MDHWHFVCCQSSNIAIESLHGAMLSDDQVVLKTNDNVTLKYINETNGWIRSCTSYLNTITLWFIIMFVIFKLAIWWFLLNSSFRLRDKFVYLHECSPFWIGIFIASNKENCHVYCFMQTRAFWLAKRCSISICYRKD